MLLNPFGEGIAERLLLLRAAKIRQAAVKVVKQGLRGALEAQKRRLGLVEMFVR